MTGVLYLSRTGLLDPLGRSQVMPYVCGLARSHSMHLLTFESAKRLADRAALRALSQDCQRAGVNWHFRRRRHPLWDVAVGAQIGGWLVRRHRLEVVHCRSYLAAMMGQSLKASSGMRFLFDMRGFWPDERVEAGIWHPQGPITQIMRQVERRLLSGADHIVSLTQSGKEVLRARGVAAPITVIPTCTDLARFRQVPMPKGPFTLGYVGATGSWYRFDLVARAVAVLFSKVPQARFRVVSRSDPIEIRCQLAAAGVDLDRVDLVAVAHDGVPAEIARMHAGIFFIAPFGAKRASCPTRMGEFLASGRPILANGGVGDVARDLTESGAGLTLEIGTGLEHGTLAVALERLLALAADPAVPGRARAAAEARFALDSGVARYGEIYRSLRATPPARTTKVAAWGTS